MIEKWKKHLELKRRQAALNKRVLARAAWRMKNVRCFHKVHLGD